MIFDGEVARFAAPEFDPNVMTQFYMSDHLFLRRPSREAVTSRLVQSTYDFWLCMFERIERMYHAFVHTAPRISASIPQSRGAGTMVSNRIAVPTIVDKSTRCDLPQIGLQSTDGSLRTPATSIFCSDGRQEFHVHKIYTFWKNDRKMRLIAILHRLDTIHLADFVAIMG